MYVWEIKFEVSWSYLPVGEFDEDNFETVHVVAPDYNSALDTAKSHVASLVVDAEDDLGKEYFVRDARLVEIKRDIEIDAIVNKQAA